MRSLFGGVKAVLLFVVIIATLVILTYQFVSGEYTHAGAVFFSCLIGLVYLLSWPPMRARPDDQARGAVLAGVGAVLIALAWLARMGTAITVAFLVSRHSQHPVFDRQLAGFALMAGVLGLVHLIGNALAGLHDPNRPGWVRSLVNVPVGVLIAGFAQPLKTAAYYALCWVPVQVYRGIDSWLHLRWLAILVDIPVWPLWLIVVFVVVNRLRRLIDLVLGPKNPLSAWLGDLKASDGTMTAEVKSSQAHVGSVNLGVPGLGQDYDPEMYGPRAPRRTRHRR